MFEEVIFMIGFLLFSIAVSYILLKYTPSPLNKLVLGLALVGIVIHELCHLLMCIITNAPVKSVKLLERFKLYGKEGDKHGYRGNITVNMEKKLTFLQAFLIGFAPLIFSFWLFFFLLDLFFTADLDAYIAIILIFIMVSIVLAAAPSAADILNIPGAFQEDPKYSCYQIFLLILSIISVWILSILYQITFFHEIVNYLLILVFYYGFKYGFIGIKKCFFFKNNSHKFLRYSSKFNQISVIDDGKRRNF